MLIEHDKKLPQSVFPKGTTLLRKFFCWNLFKMRSMLIDWHVRILQKALVLNATCSYSSDNFLISVCMIKESLVFICRMI